MSKYRKKGLEAELEELAIEGISLIEGHARENFGISFKIGIELEGHLVYEGEPTKKPSAPSSGVFNKFASAKIQSIDDDGKKISRSKPIIEKFMKENGLDKYEFVTITDTPIKSARRTEVLKVLANEKAPEAGFAEFITDAYVAHKNIHERIKTAGMHINLSMWRDGKNLIPAETGGYKIDPSDMARACCNIEALMLFRDALFATEMSEKSDLRYIDGHTNSPQEIGLAEQKAVRSLRMVTRKGGVAKARIENRLPSAEANAFMATLVTMSAIYLPFEKRAYIKDGRLEMNIGNKDLLDDPIISIPRIPNQAVEIFSAENNSFRKFLNELSGGRKLGDKIVEKTLEYAKEKGFIEEKWADKVKNNSSENNLSI